ncbi:MAG TPA: peptidylprolyl isomerase [Thermoclostridium caenicola]|uniref:PPIC-type PPIASE domain-containing protein n=1 Tax=Thermoclostridium caenicola TaxID=659425 RepID=A0A1M6C916_9FIRM|nr:peptidylprolyl isomerase [Thermoclostridium caenicola]SHI57499.1 PPIC-type PPIASE domain-containing protein [Thermoclostridium caenicola]HOK42476.1 peptidylprolyl isomerase [Thermoclostridium caenicola]HOL84383.1 peptidylprolyl isomerase [Thermoclostridium caenicola]HOP71693.1 peptidylprolyl isomerase [Thermoclostridium caenicola]HPO77567.1 peptidylprolyl isomerase [Thermoclostridium caenicola]
MDKKRKNDQGSRKKKLIRTKREAMIIRTVTILILVIAAFLIWYLIDSRSYVATVAGRRIMKYEYEFLLRQQILKTEQDWGISGKSDAEKEQYWLKTEGGQNPWETAKNETLNTSKKYMIQLIKAKEMGITVDSSVRSEVNRTLLAYQQQLNASDSDFARWVEQSTGVTLDQYRKILERTKVNEKFRNEYIKQNYTPPEITEEEIRAEYEKNGELYDSADIRYVYLKKFDENGTTLPQDQIDAKMAKAMEVLEKIKKGEDMDTLIANYSEESSDDSDEERGKATVNSSSYLQLPYFKDLFDFALEGKAGDADIVDTDMVIFVVRIDKHTEFDDVKNTVKSYLEASKEAEWYNSELDKWSSDTRFNIIKNDVVYDAITYQNYRKK